MATPSSSALAAFPTARFASVGQSLAAFIHYTPSGYAFKTKLAEIMRGSANAALIADGIEIAPYASGGSFASALNHRAADSSAGVHWDDILNARGSICESAWDRMDERDPDNLVQHLLADQGQADASVTAGLYVDATYPVDPTDGANNWYSAWHNHLIAQYRENMDPATSRKIAWAMLGRSTSSSITDSIGYHRIREKQNLLITNNSSIIFKALETWDLELQDSVHPSIVGQIIYGHRLAESVAKNIYGVTTYTDASDNEVTIYDGPTFSSVTLEPDNVTVKVVLAGDAGDTIFMPSREGPPPCGFMFWDSSVDMNAVYSTADPFPGQRPKGDWDWDSGDKEITFTLATPITGTLKMAFPFDNVPDFNPDLVIKGNTSGKPLQTKFI